MTKPASTTGWALFGFLTILACIRLLNTASAESADFSVFWRAAHCWWTGMDPYRFPTLERGFVFKYPPGMLPLFLPLAWVGLKVGKVGWAIIEILSLLYCAQCLRRQGAQATTIAVTTCLYWYLWFEHFKYGQVMLPLLAVGLWATSARRRMEPLAGSVLQYLFSLKIFTAYGLAGDARRMLAPQTLLGTLALAAGFHFVLVLVALKSGHAPFAEIASMYTGWLDNAMTSARELGLDNVRGAVNHGFPALILRHIDPDARHPSWDIPVSFALAIGLGMMWWRASISIALSWAERWSGWLALTAVTHPLAWSHSFIFAYPLFVYALDAICRGNLLDWSSDRLVALLLWGLGITLTGLWVRQVVLEMAVPVELWGTKSWGVTMAACSLVLIRKSNPSLRSDSVESYKTK